MEKNAVYIGEKWLPYQEAERCFTVHSVFSRVVNVSTECGLLSIASSDIGGSSSFLSLPGVNIDLDTIPGEKCDLCNGRLYLGKNTINFINAPVWKGPISKGYRSNIKEENIAAFKAVLDRKVAQQSSWKHINSAIESRYNGLGAIQKIRENPSIIQNLIGLGMGLTPAGDDMVLGFLAIVNHTCENREFIGILHSIIADLLPKTTDISAQALENALNYDYHEIIQNCIRDLCECNKEEVYISAASLMNIGATSGTDIACGMYYGMIQ